MATGSVGLSGRAFIPLLSSFACAIPGIMATRSIQDPRDRLATIIVAPLMTCSARLPVYALLIGAFIPAREVGWFNLQGLVLFGLYAAGILSALAVAWVMKKWRRDKSEHPLMLELPSYGMPHPRDSPQLGLEVLAIEPGKRRRHRRERLAQTLPCLLERDGKTFAASGRISIPMTGIHDRRRGVDDDALADA